MQNPINGSAATNAKQKAVKDLSPKNLTFKWTAIKKTRLPNSCLVSAQESMSCATWQANTDVKEKEDDASLTFIGPLTCHGNVANQETPRHCHSLPRARDIKSRHLVWVRPRKGRSSVPVASFCRFLNDKQDRKKVGKCERGRGKDFVTPSNAVYGESHEKKTSREKRYQNV